MRFTEIKSVITEAKIDNKYYTPGRTSSGDKYRQNVIDAIAAGGPLYVTDVDKQTQKVFFPDSTRDAAIEIVKSHQGTAPAPVATGTSEDGVETIEFQIDKIEKKFKKGEIEASSVNVGNVTEGVLGLAIAAKFSNTSKQITDEDIIELGKRFISSGSSIIKINVADRTNDNLQLKITLPSGDIKGLQTLLEMNGDGKKTAKILGLTPQAAKKLDSLIKKCANYANNGENPKIAVSKIQEFYQDDVVQVIEVTSDGAEAENQNMTKVDLKLTVKGKETQTLSLLSLKAGSGRSQIGQASGKQFSNLRLYWKQNFNYELPTNYQAAWDSLYKEIANEKGKVENTPQNAIAILNGPIRKTYDWAQSKIAQHLKGDNTQGEVSFLENLQKGLLYHSGKNIDPTDRSTKTKGDENVIVTIIDFGKTNDFTELRFGPAFFNLMTYFDLESTGVTEADGGKGLLIQVLVRPNKERLADVNTPDSVKQIATQLGSGKVLVQYRSYIQGSTTVRNIVEVDKGAKILGSLSNEQFNIAKAMKNQQTKPSAEPVQPNAEPAQVAQPAPTNNPNAKL